MFTNVSVPGGGTTIISFLTAVSAVGFDGIYSINKLAFELYDKNNVLLDSSLTAPKNYNIIAPGTLSGFFGLSTGLNNISTVKIHMPTKENLGNLYLDNVIYQTVEKVPEPTSITLLGMGALGFRSITS